MKINQQRLKAEVAHHLSYQQMWAKQCAERVATAESRLTDPEWRHVPR